MNRSSQACAVILILLIATMASGEEKTPRSYQKGTITDWDTRIDVRNAGNGQRVRRRTRVYSLKTPDLVYEIDDCGSFQAGQFTAGQAVEYRVDDVNKRVYIRREDDKEYKCKMEGASIPQADPTEATSPH